MEAAGSEPIGMELLLWELYAAAGSWSTDEAGGKVGSGAEGEGVGESGWG